jgi:hypothetical protein
MAVGNEGAGVVVAAGSAPEAQALLGRTVAIIGGATYAEALRELFELDPQAVDAVAAGEILLPPTDSDVGQLDDTE